MFDVADPAKAAIAGEQARASFVLTRALRYHLESRVLISGHKTIVFAD